MNREEYFATVEQYKLLAKHEVGQNFLIDSDACERIVGCLDMQPDDYVLEIGSGAGSLSFFLYESKVKAQLIDIDEGLVTKLTNDFSDSDTISPTQGNAMKWDYSPYSKIIGNLPYYITSGIIEKVLLGSKTVQKAVFMVQKEAFNRLAAKINTNEYGPLQILIEYRGKIAREFNVTRTSFSPAPHVDSTVFSITFNDNRDLEECAALNKLTTALFLNRRKTILNNLSRHIGNSEKAKVILAACGIKENARPENLSLAQYLSILRGLK